MKNALCLGTFDGVHKGHKEVLNLPKGFKKIAVTFSMPPKTGHSGNPELIMTLKDKCRALKKMGVEEILTLDFAQVKDMEPDEFLGFIYQKYEPEVICCGFNYRFGKNAKGDIDFLRAFCEEKGITFNCLEPVKMGSKVISSTLIRDYIKNGEIETANELLSEPFSFEGEVIKGDGRGRTLGFPTANQRYPEELVRLKFGVYKTRIIFEDRAFEGITNIGIRPTFETDYVLSETYIKDFHHDLYGKTIRIELLEFLREEIKFSSADELKKQIIIDLEK